MTISIPHTIPASAASLAALRERYGTLPSEYVEFLALHDGARPPSNVLEGTHFDVGVCDFLPASEIADRSNVIEGLSPNLLPFASDDCGNFLCIGADDHRIYFWDHEFDSSNVVAQNFGEFIRRLEPFDLSMVDLEPRQVTRIWVNPNFKPEF